MRRVSILSLSTALIIALSASSASADGVYDDDERDTYRFNYDSPSFSLGIEVPKSAVEGSALAPLIEKYSGRRPLDDADEYAERSHPDKLGGEFAPLDDDFAQDRSVDQPRPYAERTEPGFDELDEREHRSLKGGDFENDQARGNYSGSETRIATRYAYCLPDHTVSRNLRAAGWHNFRRYRYTERKVKVTADNAAGLPFRLTIDRCSGAILFARLL